MSALINANQAKGLSLDSWLRTATSNCTNTVHLKHLYTRQIEGVPILEGSNTTVGVSPLRWRLADFFDLQKNLKIQHVRALSTGVDVTAIGLIEETPYPIRVIVNVSLRVLPNSDHPEEVVVDSVELNERWRSPTPTPLGEIGRAHDIIPKATRGS